MTIANEFLKELSLIERDRRNYADGLLLCGFIETREETCDFSRGRNRA